MALILSLGLFGCGGGSSTPPPANFTVGGTVSALAGSGLVLQNNGGDNLPVSANESFTFKTALASRSSYNVTVLVQPSSPAQTCVVTNGSGTLTANVTNIMVNCGKNEWVWENGANVVNQAGVYGTMGTPASTNVPGARELPVAWTDSSGALWLFGGANSTGALQFFNDLWKYSAGEWTWVSGSNLVDQNGTYGTLGVPDPANVPGGRFGSVGWKDSAGSLWLFGGAPTRTSMLNDLWRYSAGEWTWMSGSNTFGQPGVYGTKGTPDPANVPGSRFASVGWTDPTGGFWLFGGLNDSGGEFNDLWRYQAGEWTWMNGANVMNQPGTYGTPGVPAPGNVPGARYGSVTWTDANGDFWLFGGQGLDSAGSFGYLNDLWKYSAGEWTWIGGSNVVNQLANYGVLGTAAPTNVPGARIQGIGWTDASGNFWLFGGTGVASTPSVGALNDLWQYNAGQWTWMGGADAINQPGSYGTLGTPASTTTPGARASAAAWTDVNGNLWLFGGSGYDSTGATGDLNDLWQYEP